MREKISREALDAGQVDLSDVTTGEELAPVTPGEVLREEFMLPLKLSARALARDIGGSVEGFSALMNRKCQQLGMRNSNFVNPHGLTEPGQYSTARDMAIAARAAYRSPLLRSYATTKSFNFTYNDGRTRRIENTNRLLKTMPYVDGMKTGTTNASGRCLISTGSLNGRSVVCVVLKSNTPNIWSDSEKLLRWSLERPTAE